MGSADGVVSEDRVFASVECHVVFQVAGCLGEVERFQAVMDNDLNTGHTTKGVHANVSAEIASARTTCAGGNEAGALAQINATKGKFGYR